MEAEEESFQDEKRLNGKGLVSGNPHMNNPLPLTALVRNEVNQMGAQRVDWGVKNKNTHNTQINLNKQKLGEP